MTTKLKKVLGEAGAGIDKSNGETRLYDVLKGLVESHNQLVAQFNQFRTDYNAATSPTTATALTLKVELE